MDFLEELHRRFEEFGFYETRITESNVFSANKTEDIYHNEVSELVAGLSGVNVIIESATVLIDLIIKASDKAAEIDIKAKSKLISDTFAVFLTTLADKLANRDSGTFLDKKGIDEIISGLKKSKDVVKQFENVLDALMKVVKKFPDINSDDFKSKAGVMFDSLQYILNPTNKNTLIEAGKIELDGTKEFMKKLIDVANNMSKLYDALDGKDLESASNKFIANLNSLLGSAQYSQTAASRSQGLGLFNTELKKFTKTVNTSREHVIKFTRVTNNATNALKRLDNEIIKNERKRNDAIKKFAEVMKTLADNVKSLKDNIEDLDENKILRNFENIRDLLNAAQGNAAAASSHTASATSAAGTTAQQTAMTAQREQRGVANGLDDRGRRIQYIAVPIDQKLMVKFNFKNTDLTGFAESEFM